MSSPQMCLPYTNLTSILFAETSRNDGVTALEQLFDKLIKKALAHVEYCR